MKQYIDKAEVVAEIGKLQDSTMDEDGNFYSAKAQSEYDILCVLENSINNIENIEVEHDTFIEKGVKWIEEINNHHYLVVKDGNSGEIRVYNSNEYGGISEYNENQI